MSEFLCESCGYNLSSSEEDSRCPECGRAVRDSLPESHPGTPWQSDSHAYSWVRTNWMALFRPGELFRAMSTESMPKGLLITNVLVASALLVAPFPGVFIGDWARSARGTGGLGEVLSLLSSFSAWTGVAASVLLAFTVFDVYGITLLGRVKGWRLSARTAWIICAHASAGWLVAAILPLLFMAAYYILGTLLKMDFTGPVTRAAGAPAWSWQTVLGIGLPIAGYLCGLVAFELIALKGARTCRFANPPGARPSPTAA
ncbi:MAG TPA: hypothetical protein VD997_05230 [Phycisphaerales bacterium]|nr:hypothetical protein [Phycisphaerales bacterium]